MEYVFVLVPIGFRVPSLLEVLPSASRLIFETRNPKKESGECLYNCCCGSASVFLS